MTAQPRMRPAEVAAYRARLVARAKAVAIPVASCVAASLAPAHLTDTMTRDELAALVVVLAEAIEPGRLRAVVAAADDDGLPSPGQEELRLRRAHREFMRLRHAGEPINAGLIRLERQYQREIKQRQVQRQREERALRTTVRVRGGAT